MKRTGEPRTSEPRAGDAEGLPSGRRSAFATVVLGASLGGIDALREIVGALSPPVPAAYLVVQHIGRHRSLLPSLLAAWSELPAAHALDGEAIRPGRIYVAPPDHHLCVAPSRIRLVRGPRENYTRPAIDPLFRSAAQSHGDTVFGVLLTGSLSDGVAGLLEVRRRGGVAIVQDPAEAVCPDMPLNALRNAGADHVMPLAAMPDLIARLAETIVQRSEAARRIEGERDG